MPERLCIAQTMYDEMVAHAQADAPNECCGLIACSGETAVSVHRAQNAAASPLKFEIDGRELLRTYTAIQDEGYELGAIYHSHTRTEPYPSQTDINFAKGWPGVQWVILGLAGPEPFARIFEISDGRVLETELAIE